MSIVTGRGSSGQQPEFIDLAEIGNFERDASLLTS